MSKIQLRRDTESNWKINNPTLLDGEIGLITDSINKNYKIGDGKTEWNKLSVLGGVGMIDQTPDSENHGEVFNDYSGRNKAVGIASHVEGYYTVAKGNFSHAEGFGQQNLGSRAFGVASHAEGFGTFASGDNSHSEGESTTSSGKSSHSEGYITSANGNFSHAEGFGNVSNGQSSHSEGTNSGSFGIASHSEGGLIDNSVKYLDITNIESISNGIIRNIKTDIGNKKDPLNQAVPIKLNLNGKTYYTTLKMTEFGSVYELGDKSISVSYVSSLSATYLYGAYGDLSHAENNKTWAIGNYSHAEGNSTVSNNFLQHTQGQFNLIDESPIIDSFDQTKPAFIIGNGTSDESRGDGFRILFNGTTQSDGSYTTPAADYAEMFEWEDGNPDNEDRVGFMVELNGEKIKLSSGNGYNIGVVSAFPAMVGDNPMRWHGKYATDEWGRPILEEKEVKYIETEQNDNGETIEVEKNKIEKVYKLDKKYDSSKTFVERSKRKEWSAIGMFGKLLVRQDGSLVQGKFCLPKNGVAVNSEKGYYVMKVINDKQALILFK